MGKQKPASIFDRSGLLGKKRLATSYSPTAFRRSTIAAEELNCRVRNGNGCCLLAIVTSQEKERCKVEIGVFERLLVWEASRCDLIRLILNFFSLVESSSRSEKKVVKPHGQLVQVS